jgi:peptidyl-prolyl cis-trans isomerase C
MMKKIPLIILILGLFSTVAYADKVLVTIGKSGQVTQQQLETAMSAAPFSTQFPSMDEKDQAYLRGDILLRMARAEALFQEAVLAGKNQSVLFQQEMGNFKTSLLAQRYITNLQQQIKVPKDVEQQLTDNTQGNNDAYIAARSAYIAKHFVVLKEDSIKQLIKQGNVKTYFERLDKKPSEDTILAEGDELKIKYADVVPIQNKEVVDKQRIKDKVNEWIKLTLTAKAAVVQGENVDAQLQEYAHNLTIRLLLAEKEQQWIPDEQTLRDYFQRHPEIGTIPERRQIGQIVLATKLQAEDIQARIKNGESLFELAGQYSIDPYGKQRSGDMGWLKEGRADKEIEKAIKDLKDNEVSEIVKTAKGWHLVTIVTRKPSEQKNYAAIKDRVRQKLIAEKMTVYLQEVTAKHPLHWQIDEHTQIKQD